MGNGLVSRRRSGILDCGSRIEYFAIERVAPILLGSLALAACRIRFREWRIDLDIASAIYVFRSPTDATSGAFTACPRSFRSGSPITKF